MRKKNLAIRLVTIFMLLTPSPLSTAFSSIHVATCMAQQFDKVVDNTPDSIAKALSARPAPGSTRKGSNPGAVPRWKQHYAQWHTRKRQ